MSTSRKIRVLLWADAPIVVEPVCQAIAAADDITLIDTTSRGIRAVTALLKGDVDVVVLDVGHRSQDIAAAIKRLKNADPAAHIVMVGSLRFDTVRASMAGLMAGAAQFVPVPTKHSAVADESIFRKDFLRVLRALTVDIVQNLTSSPPAGRPTTIRPAKPGSAKPMCLLIGSSTGGPQAVNALLKDLGTPFPLPILIVQHMPAAFTNLFASNLSRRTGFAIKEAANGDIVSPGHGFVAPGGWHMMVRKNGSQVSLNLSEDPPINFVRPAVDPTFQTAVEAYNGRVIAVVLTGMGQDGAAGAKVVADRGGVVIAQDKESSVVWGMPGAVVAAGAAHHILPLSDIAAKIRDLL